MELNRIQDEAVATGEVLVHNFLERRTVRQLDGHPNQPAAPPLRTVAAIPASAFLHAENIEKLGKYGRAAAVDLPSPVRVLVVVGLRQSLKQVRFKSRRTNLDG